jgi:DNA-binding transcriptional regulator YiaG
MTTHTTAPKGAPQGSPTALNGDLSVAAIRELLEESDNLAQQAAFRRAEAGDLVCEIRCKCCRISRAALAERLGISEWLLEGIEDGRQRPSETLLRKLEQELGPQR